MMSLQFLLKLALLPLALAFVPPMVPSKSLLLDNGPSMPLEMSTVPAEVYEERPFRIGTRGSPLAMAQALETKRLLQAIFPDLTNLEIVVLKTQGDMILDKSLMELGGKGLFTKELDVALLSNQVDICVHSMKDVPTWLPEGTVLPCMLTRENTNDAFIVSSTAKGGSVAGCKRIEDLPDGSVIGTASLRRQAQILAKNPTLKCVNFRGNLQTRLRKLEEGVVDATMLAVAGLNRMKMESCVTSVLEWDEMLPAVAQGAIGIQCRSNDATALRYLAALNHEDTKICVDCERSFLATLDGNCRTPIAGQAKLVYEGGARRIQFRGLVSLPDGSETFHIEAEGDAANAVEIGKKAGEDIRAKAGSEFFKRMVELSPAK